MSRQHLCIILRFSSCIKIFWTVCKSRFQTSVRTHTIYICDTLLHICKQETYTISFPFLKTGEENKTAAIKALFATWKFVALWQPFNQLHMNFPQNETSGHVSTTWERAHGSASRLRRFDSAVLQRHRNLVAVSNAAESPSHVPWATHEGPLPNEKQLSQSPPSHPESYTGTALYIANR